MKIGLYFGSFNPIHIGHLIVANAILRAAELDEVQFVISPQSPFKVKSDLAPQEDRKNMVALAVADNPLLSANDIEFTLPKPSYTINTLTALNENNQDEYAIIMGSDNIVHFHKWKEYEAIVDLVSIHVYQREIDETIPKQWKNHDKIHFHPLPLINVSSTFIRRSVKQNNPITYWTTKAVEAYIRENNLYR